MRTRAFMFAGIQNEERASNSPLLEEIMAGAPGTSLPLPPEQGKGAGLSERRFTTTGPGVAAMADGRHEPFFAPPSAFSGEGGGTQRRPDSGSNFLVLAGDMGGDGQAGLFRRAYVPTAR